MVLLLSKVYDAYRRGILPEDVLNDVLNNVVRAEECLAKVEEACGFSYPLTVVEPVLKILFFKESLSTAPVYAYTSPYYFGDRIRLSVVLSAPLLLYASDQLLIACLAHELLHYVHLTIAFHKMRVEQLQGRDVESLEGFLSFEESSRADAKKVFRNADWLVSLVKDLFSPVLDDPKLNEKTMKYWVERGLPTVKVSPSEHVARIPLADLNKLILDYKVVKMFS
ncbi:MAG: hypothetical protein DRJ31_08035 [Candidatus Methanomethylicota archaeon]|uniref:Uncharacterized protein n=1 Tax=Thermoproteota archaeon TaxID=2056631 RepID=A0A497EMJ6_9CREN|nr:MAG: hypothetical protein DRJ31_08035 [Candidatus Verstraetearchaeota archaeon]